MTNGPISYPSHGLPAITEAAINLYERIANDEQPQPADRDPLIELLTLGLLREGPSEFYTPVDPSYADASWTAAYYGEARRNAERAGQVTPTLAPIQRAWDARPAGTAGAVEHLRGIHPVNTRLGQIVAGCKYEILVAQPGGPRRAEFLDEMFSPEIEAVRRGVAVRTIYHESARSGEATNRWVETMRAAGAETRTLAEEFARIVIIDRRVAVVPGSDTFSKEQEAVAHLINDPGVVGYLAGSFDRCWARALPWTNTTTQGEPTDRQLVILQGMLRGEAQDRIGSRLGLAKRQMVKEVATLKVFFGGEDLTLIQLGWRARPWMEAQGLTV